MANTKLINVDLLQYFKGKQDAYNDGIYAKKADLTTVFTYKGSVATYADLPAADQVTGDVYNITAADAANNINAGDNVVWNGSDWDNLAGVFDVSEKVKVTAEAFTAGTKIASIEINGTTTEINAPTVAVAADATTGNKLATITIDGTATDIYAETAAEADIDALFATTGA